MEEYGDGTEEDELSIDDYDSETDDEDYKPDEDGSEMGMGYSRKKKRCRTINWTPEGPFRFLDLPRELRDMIYGLVLVPVMVTPASSGWNERKVKPEPHRHLSTTPMVYSYPQPVKQWPNIQPPRPPQTAHRPIRSQAARKSAPRSTPFQAAPPSWHWWDRPVILKRTAILRTSRQVFGHSFMILHFMTYI